MSLINTLRMYAEDMHSATGYSERSSAMSKAADMIEKFENMSACEACATIPSVMEYVQQLEQECDELKEKVARLSALLEAEPFRNERIEQIEQERDSLKEALTIEKANSKHWEEVYTKWAETDLAATRLKELERERDEAVSAVQRLTAGGSFDATVIADTVKRRTALIEQECGTLAAQNEALRSALHKLACLGNGDSFGNSVGNCIAQDALNLPNLATEVLKRRDAQVLRRAADSLRSEFHEHAAADVLRMIEK